MAENVTYYAIIDSFASRNAPAGVLRRFGDGSRRDESFGRDLEWKFSPLLHSAERGDTQYDLVPISEEEAEGIVARIRQSVGGGQELPGLPNGPRSTRWLLRLHNSGMPVTIPRRRIVRTALIAQAVLVALGALAGCTGGGGSTVPKGTPQTVRPSATRSGQSASAVLQSALAALRTGVSVHFSGTTTISSHTIALSEDSAADSGRQAFTINGSEHANVLVVGKISYIQGDEIAMINFFGLQPTIAARLAGRWISFSPGDSGGGTSYGQVTAGVTLASVAEEMDLTGPLTLTAPTVIAGKAVIGVHGTVPASAQDPPGTTATLYVAASGRPLPVSEQVDLAGAKATYTFSQWGEPLHLTGPPNPIPITSITSSPTTV